MNLITTRPESLGPTGKLTKKNPVFPELPTHTRAEAIASCQGTRPTR